MSKPNIIYDYAHVILDPSELKSMYGEEYKSEFKNGQLNSARGIFHMSLVNDCVLEMHGIAIPSYGIQELSSDKAIVNSIQRLVGDFGNSLERCFELAKERIIQDSLYFTPNGLYDYSKENKLDGKQVTEWVRHAKDYPFNLKEVLPNDMKLPEGLEVKFVPTFQALRDIDTLSLSIVGSCYTIRGETFANCVENFLAMYEAVTTHINWEEQTRNQIILHQSKKGEHIHSGTIPVAELIFPVL